ncbi:MAG TPA: SIR2 family protein, partial [Mucilaginibacter sp.]
MVENDLFEAIRREDVVIFAGAGFSGYAGYPLGSSLGKELFDALLPGEQTEELKALPLDYLAEQIVRIRHGSRDLINQVLDDVFGAPPTSNKDHELLASIPHFKTIITTNYDRLFENAYGEAATLIFREQDVTKWKEGGVNIIKIHGDLSDKASVILTRNDYSRFYRTDYSSPFWASITKDIATKTILFLGYGYEDPNVWAIFERVYEHIGDKRKAAYFIGPNVDAVKVSYLEAKGIEYMNRTGGDFLSALMKHIEDHIFSDIEQRWVSSETFWKFTRSRNLEVPLRDSTSGLRVVSINGMDGQQMNGHIKFTINPESDFPERHKAF